MGTVVVTVQHLEQNALVRIPHFVSFFRLWVRFLFLYVFHSLLCNKASWDRFSHNMHSELIIDVLTHSTITPITKGD